MAKKCIFLDSLAAFCCEIPLKNDERTPKNPLKNDKIYPKIPLKNDKNAVIYLDLRANVAVHKAFVGRFDVICAGSFLGVKGFRSSYVRGLPRFASGENS